MLFDIQYSIIFFVDGNGHPEKLDAYVCTICV